MLKLKICTLSMLVSLISSATAAVNIDWEPTATNVTFSAGVETDVETSGDLLYAINFSLSLSPTVNGVSFSNAVGTDITTSAILNTQDRTDILPGGATYAGTPYEQLLGSNWYRADNGSTITLNNLIAGKTYLIQIWSSDDRYSASSQQNVDGVGISTQAGQFNIGTFTADGATQVINIGADSTGILNALQVRLLPDPPKGTVIMISSLGGWLILCFVFVLRSETTRSRDHN